MNRQVAAIAVSLVLASASLASAQTPSRPGTSPSTPGMASPSGSVATGTAAAAGRHSMEGEVTRIDAKKGWVHVKTDEGTMIAHFPSEALGNVKKGDRVTVNLALKSNGPQAK